MAIAAESRAVPATAPAPPTSEVPPAHGRPGPEGITPERWRAQAASANRPLWAIAVVLISVRVGTAWTWPLLGYDLRPVYEAGKALGAGKSVFAVSSFVYPPSAALVVGWPLSLFGFGGERHVALIAVPMALIGASMLGARCMGRPWFGTAAAAGAVGFAICGFFGDLLDLENVSAFIALGAAAVMLAWLRGRFLTAGALLGLTLAVKPMLAVLLLALVVLRRWRALAVAVAVPLLLNALVLAVDPAAVHGAGAIVSDLLAGHGSSFDVRNGALSAIGQLLGWPAALTLAVRVVVGLLVVVAVVVVWRRRPDPARSLEAAALLVAGVFVTSSLFEDHFLFVLVPFAFAALDRGSPLRWWPIAFVAPLAAGVAIVPTPRTGLSFLEVATIQRGLGLSAVIVCAATVLLVREGRLRRPDAEK